MRALAFPPDNERSADRPIRLPAEFRTVGFPMFFFDLRIKPRHRVRRDAFQPLASLDCSNVIRGLQERLTARRTELSASQPVRRSQPLMQRFQRRHLPAHGGVESALDQIIVWHGHPFKFRGGDSLEYVCHS